MIYKERNKMARKTYRRIIVTPELLEKVNKENIKLTERFLKEKATRSSNLTVEGYRSDLNIFWCWNLEHNDNKFFIDIKKIEFADFFNYVVEELRWGSSRFSRLRSCLSSFSQFIEKFYDSEYKDFRNVILKVIESMPKVEQREKTVLSDEQIENLLQYLSETIKEPQQAAWLALAIASGCRFSELLRFETTNIDKNNLAFNQIFIETLRPIRTKGRGRNGKMQNKYIILDVFLPYYEKWLVEREKIMKENSKEHDFLFIKLDGSPATSGTVRSWLGKMTRFLGTDIYPHCFRHYVTTKLSKYKLPEKLITEILGWSNSIMIQTYNDQTAKNTEWAELENMKKPLLTT